jgi:hypothetical protein
MDSRSIATKTKALILNHKQIVIALVSTAALVTYMLLIDLLSEAEARNTNSFDVCE